MTRHKMLFLDTETTGLDITRHEVWEFAAIEVNNDNHIYALGKEHHLVWEPTWLEEADPGAIKVNHYYERTARMGDVEEVIEWDDLVDTTGQTFSDPADAAKYIARLCEDAILIGNNPAFDEMFLAKFCRDQAQVLAPFHRKINVVDMALQRCIDMAHNHADADLRRSAQEAVHLPHSSTKVLDAAGCPKNENPHTALGDAKHVQQAFRHLWGTYDVRGAT